MLVLVIDTSSAAVTAGVVELTAAVEPAAAGEPRLRAERVTVDGRAHGELLAPSIRACLAEAEVGFADLAAIVAGTGPGPFTGLRVGLVTAAVLADAAGLPSYPVCSLDGIAAGHAEVADLLVAGDARRREIYWARYRYGVRIGEPAVNKPAELPPAQLSGITAMAGAGAASYFEQLGLPMLSGRFPSALGLATVAAPRVLAGEPSQPLTPLYLRRPDAVAATARKAVTG